MKTSILYCNILLLFLILSCKDESTTPEENLGPNEIKICSQVWMKKNLSVDLYRNGDTIRNCRTIEEWRDARNKKEGAWCYYNNDSLLGEIYGKLYNWYAVNDPRLLAPEGWHIPKEEDWRQLELCLGLTGTETMRLGFRGRNEGGKLKEEGTIHWLSPNSGANNISGFSALPGGKRDFFNGLFYYIGEKAVFWSSTQSDPSGAWHRYVTNSSAQIDRYCENHANGYSVRLIKDN
ncbi:MAG: hypothetical protein QG635_1090 [Bacteroidota bacterium]|nr:hypothetical protein [Bacteroidota bacterium]